MPQFHIALPYPLLLPKVEKVMEELNAETMGGVQRAPSKQVKPPVLSPARQGDPGRDSILL